jgi:hypothetical protein
MSTLAAFYTSPTFWTAVTAMATVLLIAATLARRAPKQKRLTYRQEVVPLLNGKASVELEIWRGGNRLEDPHIVEFVLVNRSRQDIGSEAFDQQAPITADFGHPILESFGCTPHPETSRPPKSEIHGTELHVLPGRIGRGDTMTYRVLVDGHPRFGAPTHQLMHGKLERDPGDSVALPLSKVLLGGAGCLAVGNVALWLLNETFDLNLFSQTLPNGRADTTPALFLGIAFAAVAALLGWSLWEAVKRLR